MRKLTDKTLKNLKPNTATKEPIRTHQASDKMATPSAALAAENQKEKQA